jgi:predicted ribosomally synthesized peptide with SipW-like signal peptide
MPDRDIDLTLNRRQLLGGLLTLGSASAAAGAGTFALFSDSESATGIIDAASLDLEVVGTDGESTNGGPATFLDGVRVSPGSSGSGTVTLRNVGSIDGHLSLTAVRVVDAENGVSDPEADAGDDSPEDGELAENLVASASLSGADGSRDICPGGTALPSLFAAGVTYDAGYPLAAGEEATFEFEWELPESVGNEIQGDSAGLELSFGLHQRPTGEALPTCGGNGGEDTPDGGDGDDSGSGVPAGVVFTRNGAVGALPANGGGVFEPGGDANSVVAIGPATLDFDGDGANDVPFLKNKNSLRLLDADDGGSRRTNLASGNGPRADTEKTALAVGVWDGSAPSVFYAGAGNAGLYRVAPGGSPAVVADPAAGVSAVLGPGDIDGDGSEELLFVDDSKVLRYIEAGGTLASTGVTVGSSNGVGAGPPVAVGGAVRVPVVDGSNAVHLVGPNGVTATLVSNGGNEGAAKTALAATDVDGDGDPEVVYLDNASSELKYVDDVTGAKEVKTLADGDGNPIAADAKRGVLPGHTGDGGGGNTDGGDAPRADDLLSECGLGEDDLAPAAYDALRAAVGAGKVRTVTEDTGSLTLGDGEAVFLEATVERPINRTGDGNVLVVCGANGGRARKNVRADHAVLADTTLGSTLDADTVSVAGDVTIGANLNLAEGLLHVASGSTLTLQKHSSLGTLHMDANATLANEKGLNCPGEYDLAESAEITGRTTCNVE